LNFVVNWKNIKQYNVKGEDGKRLYTDVFKIPEQVHINLI
jgi:hypothetical protein